jgi:polysaccharide biosynthesis protein PslH
MADRRALLLSPESPYPPHGGGALRTTSIAEYLRGRYELDMVVFAQQGDPEPAGASSTIRLPRHSRSTTARASRNLVRLVRGAPPLMDRFAGCEEQIERAIGDRRYEVAILEHFWTAPYFELVARRAERVILDLHNIESVWLEREAGGSAGPKRVAFERWAEVCRRLEADLLPRFSSVLVTSEADAAKVQGLAPGVRVVVYPNAIPLVPQPECERRNAIVFSGNLEYEPNRRAVDYFSRSIWPAVADCHPELEWHLVGRNPEAVRAAVSKSPRVRVVGVVEDAVGELARYRAAVVPVLTGSGTRLKIIEAWAAGTPVVSTTLGAEGLEVGSGTYLLLADDPFPFVNQIGRVLDDPVLAQSLASSGRQLYEQRFCWSVAWRTLRSSGF